MVFEKKVQLEGMDRHTEDLLWARPP
jgi:hypothetical protein